MKARHRFLLVIPITITFIATEAVGQTAEKKAAQEALDSIKSCNHLAGETGDRSNARNREITRGMAKDCAEADEKIGFIAKNYPLNSLLVDSISSGVMSGTLNGKSKAIQSYCTGLIPLFVNKYQHSDKARDTYNSACPQQASATQGIS